MIVQTSTKILQNITSELNIYYKSQSETNHFINQNSRILIIKIIKKFSTYINDQVYHFT